MEYHSQWRIFVCCEYRNAVCLNGFVSELSLSVSCTESCVRHGWKAMYDMGGKLCTTWVESYVRHELKAGKLSTTWM